MIVAYRNLEISYENFIANHTETLELICNFIGTSYNSSMLGYVDETDYKLPDTKFLNQWQSKLSAFDMRLIEAEAGDFIEKRGYSLSGYPKLTINSFLKAQLILQDYFVRIKFRVNQFGVALVVADYLSRHLRLNAWQKRILAKQNLVVNAHCKFDGNPILLDAVNELAKTKK